MLEFNSSSVQFLSHSTFPSHKSSFYGKPIIGFPWGIPGNFPGYSPGKYPEIEVQEHWLHNHSVLHKDVAAVCSGVGRKDSHYQYRTSKSRGTSLTACSQLPADQNIVVRLLAKISLFQFSSLCFSRKPLLLS